MTTRFILCREHLDLLRAMNWWWQPDYHGGPGVDPKRPFGFSSDLDAQLAKAVGWIHDPDDGEQAEELGRLWHETFTALMVGLSAGTFEPGEYVLTGGPGSNDWRRVELIAGGDLL